MPDEQVRRRMRFLERTPRQPVWSGVLTTPLARRIPIGARPAVLVLIKAFHSLAFFSIGGLIVLFTWDGFRGRLNRRTRLAGLVAVAESAVYATNNMVCPLTPLAEELGANRGSVTDIYLPDWLSRRVPLFGGGTLLIGILLHARLGLRNERRSRSLAAPTE